MNTLTNKINAEYCLFEYPAFLQQDSWYPGRDLKGYLLNTSHKYHSLSQLALWELYWTVPNGKHEWKGKYKSHFLNAFFVIMHPSLAMINLQILRHKHINIDAINVSSLTTRSGIYKIVFTQKIRYYSEDQNKHPIQNCLASCCYC
jgi:hypothetical protein